MIRSAGMIARNAAYVPPDMNNYRQGSLDTLWHEWSLHEMTKRSVSSENFLIAYPHLITAPSGYPTSTIHVTAYTSPCLHLTSHRK